MKNNDELNINWSMITIIALGIGFWYSIFSNGFFQTIIWLIIISALIGIIIKVYEQPWR